MILCQYYSSAQIFPLCFSESKSLLALLTVDYKKIHHSSSQETGAMDLSWREHNDQHRHTSGACSALKTTRLMYPGITRILPQCSGTKTAGTLHWEAVRLSTPPFPTHYLPVDRNPQHVTLHSCISINIKNLI